MEENNAVIQQLFDEVSSTQASVLKYSIPLRKQEWSNKTELINLAVVPSLMKCAVGSNGPCLACFTKIVLESHYRMLSCAYHYFIEIAFVPIHSTQISSGRKTAQRKRVIENFSIFVNFCEIQLYLLGKILSS